MENKHYGTVSHWFDEGQVGAVRPDKNIGRSILLIAKHLPHGYLPKIGDEVSYAVGRDERNRECATAVEVLPGLREGARIKVALSQWDFSLNGGYGLFRQQKPVFVLGQFLRDQTRVPEEGEILRGTLIRHDNGQWLLADIETVVEAPVPAAAKPSAAAPEPKQVKPVPQRLSQATPRQSASQQIAPPAGLPLNRLLHGEVVRWEDDKGYGFIQCGSQSVFFHISAYHYRSRRPQPGEAVSFFCRLPAEAGEKQRAARVVRREDEYAIHQNEALAGEKKVDRSQIAFGILPGAVYLAALAWFFWPLALLYGAISLATLALYGYDKAVARKHAGRSGYAGRIKESTLLTAGLLGGWPGAQAARVVFNHKTTKQPFVTYFWLTVAANAAFSVWLLQTGALAQLLHLLPAVGG